MILRDVLDWSAAETAALLDISVAAANSALQRGRETLRNELPERPSERAAPELSEDEQRLLAGFIATHESGDAAAAAALMREDIRVTMPPHPMVFDGRDVARAAARARVRPRGHGRVAARPDARQPPARPRPATCASAGETEWRAFKFDILRCEDGGIAEITTFDATLFEQFGLPLTLADR